jgi:hypothetical protein
VDGEWWFKLKLEPRSLVVVVVGLDDAAEVASV